MIHAGSGIIHAGAYDALRRVAELLHAPVTTSWAARGVLPETSPLAIPMPHVKLNHQVRNDADVVLILGIAPRRNRLVGQAALLAPPVRAEDDPGRHRRRHARPEQAGRPRHPGRRQALPRAARRRAGAAQGRDPRSTRRRAARRRLRARRCATTAQGWDKALADMAVPMHPAHIGAVCREVFPEDSVLVADGGNATIWAMFYHQVTRAEHGALDLQVRHARRRHGAGAGRRRSRGRASRCAASSATARWAFIRRRSRPRCATSAQVIYLVLCDKQWGMVKMNQQFMLRPFKTMLFKHLDPDETIKADLGEIEFDKLGQSDGRARRARRPIRRS